ncbi:MAG: hypothetical protein QOI48_3070 [Solirubrobacteraceae bacterium]|jgi:hypothetical protein|nr:hypothetical protein [Solirubrobacteraceae bacterium]
MQAPVVREEIYRTYWAFAAERQRIFEARLAGAAAPWTEDPTLGSYRFCNAFRAADRVSQHLIQRAAYGDAHADADDIFLRVVMHRLFCRPATWDLLESQLDGIDATSFDPEAYDAILRAALDNGQRIYTSAFILCATPAYGFARKHRNHLALLEAMLADGVPDRVARARSLEAVYCELRQWPLIGPFMGYQLAIDLNYSPIIDFSEDDFVVPGPGAERGIAKVFVNLSGMAPAEVIRWLVEQQHAVQESLGIAPPTLFGRTLHAIDCQNLLCEVDKYCRQAFSALASNRSRIKQRYVVDPEPYVLFFPPEWHINDNIPEGRRRDVGDLARL